MKEKYTVAVPFTGYVNVDVMSENEEQAKKLAFEEDLDISDAEECYFHEAIMDDNGFYGAKNEIEVIGVE